jgi:hypothetical protein
LTVQRALRDLRVSAGLRFLTDESLVNQR